MVSDEEPQDHNVSSRAVVVSLWVKKHFTVHGSAECQFFCGAGASVGLELFSIERFSFELLTFKRLRPALS